MFTFSRHENSDKEGGKDLPQALWGKKKTKVISKNSEKKELGCVPGDLVG